ncbi:hypothetical protein D3C81_1961400 [compost metagenome]
MALKQHTLLLGLADKILDHRSRCFKIGNNPVLHGANRPDIAGGTADHHLGGVANRHNRFIGGIGALGHHGGLPDDNSFSFYIHEGVRCSQINP